MGIDCPKGHGRQNIVVNLTADGSNASKMEDVIAHKLACGCVVGGEQYEKFKAAVAIIERDAALTIRSTNEDARQKKAAVYQAFIVGKED